jgi:hypothetical protein
VAASPWKVLSPSQSTSCVLFVGARRSPILVTATNARLSFLRRSARKSNTGTLVPVVFGWKKCWPRRRRSGPSRARTWASCSHTPSESGKGARLRSEVNAPSETKHDMSRSSAYAPTFLGVIADVKDCKKGNRNRKRSERTCMSRKRSRCSSAFQVQQQ